MAVTVVAGPAGALAEGETHPRSTISSAASRLRMQKPSTSAFPKSLRKPSATTRLARSSPPTSPARESYPSTLLSGAPSLLTISLALSFASTLKRASRRLAARMSLTKRQVIPSSTLMHRRSPRLLAITSSEQLCFVTTDMFCTLSDTRARMDVCTPSVRTEV